ncbi:hypothetical protein NL676_029950 [Syzygium grande]|nr:hypothetical protein NL676_029950 [Syzygium grande]
MLRASYHEWFMAAHHARASFMAVLVPASLMSTPRPRAAPHRSWSIMVVSCGRASFTAIHRARASCRAWFLAVYRARASFMVEHHACALFMAVLMLVHRAMHRSWPSVALCASFMAEHLARTSFMVEHRARASFMAVLVLVHRAMHRSWLSIMAVSRARASFMDVYQACAS